ncbi:YqhA family protein [Janthinobacterium sp. UMAB-56]|uniref:YqhA family protein n=1 Tax=Janthinobacterium sp. UMAB-56 TaxID=1365361 RepID=UPI001C59D8B4|nr:YqhA family protein [Janthinobacterium sp. UMAB-56]
MIDHLPPSSKHTKLHPLSSFIFMSRWLQLPLYLGLILAQCVYVFHFWVELSDLIGAVFGNDAALQHVLTAVAVPGSALPTKLNEATIMLVVLGLIDVVMISNLLIMVIIGGYETFVSRMHLDDHPDQPEWLSHVNASVLKTKLAMAIIGISSIHLLKTFINANSYKIEVIIAQTVIHIVFILSAMAIAYTDRIMTVTQNQARAPH